jgi:hypothetical protein
MLQGIIPLQSDPMNVTNDENIRDAQRVRNSPLKDAAHFARYGLGYLAYLATGDTSLGAYASMRRMYVLTNGRLNDAIGRLHGAFHRPYAIREPHGVLGDLTPQRSTEIAETLKRDGFFVSPVRVPLEVCQRLAAFARDAECMLVPAPSNGPARQRFNTAALQAPRYDLEEATLLRSPDAQALLTDLSFLDVAQRYLGYAPMNDMIASWWTAPYSRKASSAAAQYYHFDLDRQVFLKMFIYLTDVTSRQGPHYFVRGSHTNKPKALLIDDRITDAQIAHYYRSEDVVEITGAAGTIILEDTRGFHKGTPVVEGARLALEVVFADSLFGQKVHAPALGHDATDEFKARLRRYRHTFRRFKMD